MDISKGKKILIFSTFAVVGLFFFFLSLVKASGFLAPLLTAIVLALIVLPLSHKMESKGLKKGWSSFLNVLFSNANLPWITGFGLIPGPKLCERLAKIKRTMEPKVEQFKTFVFEHTPMDKSDLQKKGTSNKSSSGNSKAQSAGNSSFGTGSSSKSQGSQGTSSSAGSTAQKALSFFQKAIGFIGTFLLTFIYIFFLLNYRQRFKEFLLRLFPEKRKAEVKEVVHKSAKVSQNYLIGKLMLIGFLAVIYSIGLGISGVSNFILISIIAALLTLIPYVENLIGLGMAMAFGYLTSGQTGVLIGTALTFTVAQFVESYILQPFVVGDKVDLHPFKVIVGVVAGGAFLGIIGMILAIPVLAS